MLVLPIRNADGTVVAVWVQNDDHTEELTLLVSFVGEASAPIAEITETQRDHNTKLLRGATDAH